MLYGNYTFRCLLINDALLPNYKGSTIRGLFGRALKSVVCVLKSVRCDQCNLKSRCLYTHVFETHLAVESCNRRSPIPPHPFVLEPPLTGEKIFKEGSAFDFRLLLFGEVNYQIPYIIYAIKHMGRIGIGKGLNGERGRFVLDWVKERDNLIYSRDTDTIELNDTIPSINFVNSKNYPDEEIRLNVEFLTPFRVKHKNQLEERLPFHVLVRAMLRRASSILNQYGEGEPVIDYRGLVHRAYSVKIVNSTISWFDWRRYSTRQDRSMLMGGINGSITYQGYLGEYLPLVELCSKLHIGKQTSFGLGKYKYHIEKP